MDACKSKVAALHECKQALGLLPRQCYPQTGYSGTCDQFEFEVKRCLAHAVAPRDAAVLYSTQSSRQARLDANARLQKRLRAFNQPCTD